MVDPSTVDSPNEDKIAALDSLGGTSRLKRPIFAPRVVFSPKVNQRGKDGRLWESIWSRVLF
jgi:hypothetical protein